MTFAADCLRLQAGICDDPAVAAAALAVETRFVESDPNQHPRQIASLHYQTGLHQLAGGLYRQAIGSLELAIALDYELAMRGEELGLEGEARRLLATAWLEYGDPARADRELFASSSFVSRQTQEWTVLWARILAATGLVSDAIALLEGIVTGVRDERATSLAERNASLALGCAYHAAGQLPDARDRLVLTTLFWEATRDSFDRIEQPGLGLCYLELGRVLRAMHLPGDAAQALHAAESILVSRLGAAHPGVARVHHELACLDTEAGDDEQAARRFSEAISVLQQHLAPDHPDILAARTALDQLRAAVTLG